MSCFKFTAIVILYCILAGFASNGQVIEKSFKKITQSNSAITSYIGPWKSVRYNRELVIIVNINLTKLSSGTEYVDIICSLLT
jgi:hypothetical protein